MNWIFIGFKGCGKSTHGRRLARILDRPFLDTDQLLGVRNVGEYHSQVGDAAFRARELEVVQSLVEIRGTVIATGGGTQGLELLKPHSFLVYLKVDPERLWPRVKEAPLFGGSKERFLELYWQREPGYRALTDLTLEF
jgi:shikimate kinase